MGPIALLQIYAERLDHGVAWITLAAMATAINLCLGDPPHLSPRMRQISQTIAGAIAIGLLFFLIVVQLFSGGG